MSDGGSSTASTGVTNQQRFELIDQIWLGEIDEAGPETFRCSLANRTGQAVQHHLSRKENPVVHQSGVRRPE